MHITHYTDYSLRALMYIGSKGQELSTIREIAAAYDISRNHLMKVMQELSNKGYVVTTRGKSGGVRLARAPKDINIGMLVRDIEKYQALADCFPGGPGCAISQDCVLKGILHEALESFFSTLEGYTLADLLPAKSSSASLIKLLSLPV